MDEDLVAVIDSDFTALPAIDASMGRWHGYFARAIRRFGGFAVDLYRFGELVGQSVAYRLDLGSADVGVIYYIAVLPSYRGRGYGRVLLASAEEALSISGARYFVATISGDNEPSINLFRSMGYEIYSWGGVARICGRRAMEILRMGTCGYDDDLIAVKRDQGGIDMRDICSVDGRKVKKLWREACLMPWLSLRKSLG